MGLWGIHLIVFMAVVTAGRVILESAITLIVFMEVVTAGMGMVEVAIAVRAKQSERISHPALPMPFTVQETCTWYITIGTPNHVASCLTN